MIDNYIYIIVALLPLSSLMLVTQKNPYHALVIRAILGAVSALVYAVLGAADVALTEALVGTMLAVTLYVIAVRSSLVMHLGIIEEQTSEQNTDLQEVIASIRKVVNKHYLRLELVEYSNLESLQQGLEKKEVHGICTKINNSEPASASPSTVGDVPYQTSIRVSRLFEIMETELNCPETVLKYSGEKLPLTHGSHKVSV